MNRQTRTLSALLRHTWVIDETYAQQHIPLINAYLSGNLAGSMMSSEDEDKPIGFVLAPKTKISGSARSRVGTGEFVRQELDSETSLGAQFGDDSLPAGSVGVLDVRGPIMKEGFCGSYGTEDYTAELNAIYQNDAFLGAVVLVDSGGGQLSGTPTFYDAIRNPAKPTVVLVNDGMMASAAYWLSAGADFIYASQPTDRIGSIGVFCRLRDNSGYLKQNGIREISVYSSRSTDKNKPYRDALKGDTKALVAELDEDVAQFEAAVRQGRGDKLQLSQENDEPFTGKLYTADQAIALGLIDGYGDLQAAVDKVVELAQASPSKNKLGNKDLPSAETNHSQDSTAQPAPTTSAEVDTEPDAPGAQAHTDLTNNQTQDDMFGDKHKALTALAGAEADAITDEQLNAINVNLDSLGIKGVRVISTAYLQEAQQASQDLATETKKVEDLQNQVNDLNSKVEKFGSQPGHLGTKTEKVEEKIGGETVTIISETDAELARMKGGKK